MRVFTFSRSKIDWLLDEWVFVLYYQGTNFMVADDGKLLWSKDFILINKQRRILESLTYGYYEIRARRRSELGL
jgi:hypothetical protein